MRTLFGTITDRARPRETDKKGESEEPAKKWCLGVRIGGGKVSFLIVVKRFVNSQSYFLGK